MIKSTFILLSLLIFSQGCFLGIFGGEDSLPSNDDDDFYEETELDGDEDIEEDSSFWSDDYSYDGSANYDYETGQYSDCELRVSCSPNIFVIECDENTEVCDCRVNGDSIGIFDLNNVCSNEVSSALILERALENCDFEE